MQSHFQRTVALREWWLIEAKEGFEGKRMAVAGPMPGPQEQRVVRVFTSAPIVKRYDPFTLETADGICVILQGFLNKEKTTETGFSSEWEECGENCPRKQPDTRNESAGISCLSSKKASVSKCSDKKKLSEKNVEAECNATTDSSNKSAGISCHNSKASFSRHSVKNKLSSNDRTAKKLKFDSYESSSTNEGANNDSVVSPSSITPKLSRSGRHLLPPMEFWRNQIPVYNKDGSLRGVQEDAEVAKQSGGSNKTRTQKRV